MNKTPDEIVSIIKEKMPNLPVLRDESMKRHTTFKIGGAADIYIEPDIVQLTGLVKLFSKEDIDFTVIGNGSNILVSDEGIRGVTVVVGHSMSRVTFEGDIVTAQAGALLSTVAAGAYNHSLTGLEPLAGIPGSVGGAVLMNAGAYGGELKDVIESARILLLNGDIITLKNADLDLSYRHSKIMDDGGIILEATFKLAQKDKELVRAAMKDYSERRRSKQPLEYPSAGSAFKRPEGHFAGKLIMDANLAGYAVGDAKVSEKHCGFVINTGNAKAKDVCDLMTHIIEVVKDNSGVELKPEIRKVGEFY